MIKFKAMKFWIDATDRSTYDSICASLELAGYLANTNIKSNLCCIVTDHCGGFQALSDKRDYFNAEQAEEVDISWMQLARVETVEVCGATYIKSEVESALANLTPTED